MAKDEKLTIEDRLKALEDAQAELIRHTEQSGGGRKLSRREKDKAESAAREAEQQRRRESSQKSLEESREQRAEVRGPQLEKNLQELEASRRAQQEFQAGDIEMPGDDPILEEALKKDPPALSEYDQMVADTMQEPQDPWPSTPVDAQPSHRDKVSRRVNAQPGFIDLKAEDSSGDYSDFTVLGLKTGGASGSGMNVARTNWWQPSYNNSTRVITVGTGLSFYSHQPQSADQFPEFFWCRNESAPSPGSGGPLTLTAGSTNYFWIMMTFSGNDLIEQDVADKICFDVNGDGEFGCEGSGCTTDDDSGSLKQYYIAPQTPSFTLIKTTTNSSPTESETSKYQYLGEVTVGATDYDGLTNVTSWKWRLNHCFYWDYMSLVQGPFGETASGSSSTSMNYDPPKSHSTT